MRLFSKQRDLFGALSFYSKIVFSQDQLGALGLLKSRFAICD